MSQVGNSEFKFSSLVVLRRFLLICSLAIASQGCSTHKPQVELASSNEDRACQAWLERINSELQEHGLNDPGTVSLSGFPQLRFNRFLASMTDRLTSNEAYAEWLELSRQLDFKGKMLEIENLPAPLRQQLIAMKPLPAGLNQTVENCGKRLNTLSFNNANHKNLLKHITLPDAYQSWKRVVGIYPLARLIAAIGIKNLHRELNASFNLPGHALQQQGELIRYNPPVNKLLTPEEITAIFKAATHNSLGVPSLSSSGLRKLTEQYAPIWEIETGNDNDKIGTVRLNTAFQPLIDTKQATVYSTHAYSHWHGQILLQLIYQIWLPAREKTGVFDLYGGSLDSLIWRVTLSPQGMPIAYDSIHGCGCYYLLLPAKGFRAIAPKDGAEAVLSPKSLSASPFNQRLLLRLQRRTHYLQQVSIVDDPRWANASLNYGFEDLDQLRSLATPNGSKQSMFGLDGVIAVSKRAERFFLWPFGVASPGAMRQWGTHAIAFSGRRHFDDPFLLEKLMAKD